MIDLLRFFIGLPFRVNKFYFFKKPESLPEIFIAKKGTIIQEVSVTGKTKAREAT